MGFRLHNIDIVVAIEAHTSRLARLQGVVHLIHVIPDPFACMPHLPRVGAPSLVSSGGVRSR